MTLTPDNLELLEEAVVKHATASKLAKSAKDMQDEARSVIVKILESAPHGLFTFKGGHTWEYKSQKGNVVIVTIPYSARRPPSIPDERINEAWAVARRWGVEDELFETTRTFLPDKLQEFMQDNTTDALTRAEVGKALMPFLDEGQPSRALSPRVTSR